MICEADLLVRVSFVLARPRELDPFATPASIILGVIGMLQCRILKPSTFPMDRAHDRKLYHAYADSSRLALMV